MDDNSLEKNLEKYPYLRSLTEFVLFEEKDEVLKMVNGKQLLIGNLNISTLFLEKILKDKKYFSYAYKCLRGEIASFNVDYITDGLISGFSYRKGDIVNGLEKLINEKKIKLSIEEEKNFNLLKSFISYPKFLKEFGSLHYTSSVDNIRYTVRVLDIINLMQMPDEDFVKLCHNPLAKKIMGIPKEHFIYLVYDFFKSNNLLQNYAFPYHIIKRYEKIGSYKIIDIESLNKYLVKTKDNHKINEDLKKAILKDMPLEYNLLEKAIYIYLKMGKLLTYDEKYYAGRQKAENLKHQSLDYVPSISLENNKVVCFEFNLIYASFLKELGINYQNEYKDGNKTYGSGHVSLSFRVGKYLVKADSLTSILQGDLYKIKVNEKLTGLKCLNVNEKTQEEFQNTLDKVYDLIKKEDHQESLQDVIKEYHNLTLEKINISFKEKLDILFSKLKETNLKGMDYFAYLLNLKKILFKEDNNMQVSLVKNNVSQDNYISGIIWVNLESLEDNLYYYVEPGNLRMLKLSDIQDLFDDKKIEYIYEDDPKILGIRENKGRVL